LRAMKLWVFLALTIGFGWAFGCCSHLTQGQFNLFGRAAAGRGPLPPPGHRGAPGLVGWAWVWKVDMPCRSLMGEAIQMLQRHLGRERLGDRAASAPAPRCGVSEGVSDSRLTPLQSPWAGFPMLLYQVHRLERGNRRLVSEVSSELVAGVAAAGVMTAVPRPLAFDWPAFASNSHQRWAILLLVFSVFPTTDDSAVVGVIVLSVGQNFGGGAPGGGVFDLAFFAFFGPPKTLFAAGGGGLDHPAHPGHADQ